MFLVEKLRSTLCKEKDKPAEVFTGRFIYLLDGNQTLVEPGQRIEVCEPCSDDVVSIAIYSTKPDVVHIELRWSSTSYTAFAWGVIEQYEHEYVPAVGKHDYVKVKKFNIGLAESALDHHSDHLQVRDSPLTFSSDLKTIFLAGKPLITWIANP